MHCISGYSLFMQKVTVQSGVACILDISGFIVAGVEPCFDGGFTRELPLS
ncbi:hypothetical protein B7P43_G05455 [Cryptotermes secundus]|uniref:Uncharacterized protein n=1 Tax=Cryptotermes secundus TaxID=105785 RepID=A0A2J7R1N0_9NEOP|nr:hypothetical protein B7P43_G05455 [Cryptotermes secundus]